MNFDEYSKSLQELTEQLNMANDELAKAENEDDTQSCVNKVSEINSKIGTLKDTFITEQNAAYIKAQSDFAKADAERVQALKLASDNANKREPVEKDPREIFKKGVGGY